MSEEEVRPNTAASEATVKDVLELYRTPDIPGMPTGVEDKLTTSEVKMEDKIDDDWEHDFANARNWSSGKKWTNIAIASFYTFVTPLGSSMMAPALPEIAKKYSITDPTILAMTLCVFLLSFAFGPLFLAPLSEMYGRKWVLHIGNLIYLAFNLGCAFSPTAGSLIAFRFLAGWAGAAPIAVGGGCVSDLFVERERAAAMALFSLGPLIGEFPARCF
jgi:hypothetical protein